MDLPELLSIPAWFDWRPATQPRHFRRQTPFNPSLVRLAPQHRRPIMPRRFSFQSQLGSIGAEIWTHHHHRIHPFQSQLGSIGATAVSVLVAVVAIFQSQLGSIGACASSA